MDFYNSVLPLQVLECLEKTSLVFYTKFCRKKNKIDMHFFFEIVRGNLVHH